MSVYTPVSKTELQAFLQQYPVGDLIRFRGIEAGVENSNFFVTTEGGDYVLTLFEAHTPDELHYFLALMKHWADNGIPAARPLPTADGPLLSHLNGKPAALVARLPGNHVEQATRQQCAQVGRMLAHMHVSGQQFRAYRAPDRGHAWRMQMAQKLLPQLTPEEAQLLQSELAFQQDIPFGQLPAGTIHADLFRDNVLFHQERLSGVLDMYYACTDSWLYDLAIVVNDWCSHADGALDAGRTQACLEAYRATRPWQPLEYAYWPAMLRAAALRFWLSRLHDKLNPRDGEMILQKDPAEFRDKLTQRRTQPETASRMTLDARRLLCPLPVIRTQEAVETLPAGSVITAICTDPGATHDIPAWARLHGHQVLETREANGEYIIVLRTGQS